MPLLSGIIIVSCIFGMTMSLVIAVKLQEWFTKWQALNSKFTHKMNEHARK